MPACAGTPLHCLLLPTRQVRTMHYAVIDMRRVLCPPTAPFITVEVAPIISFQAIAGQLQTLAPRHRPITAAYMNDELIGASHSVCDPVCIITLLSYRQTRSSAAQSTVCVIDTLAEALEREGFRAHFSGHGLRHTRSLGRALGGDRACSSTPAAAGCTSTTTTTFSHSGAFCCPDPPCTSTTTTTPSLWQEGPSGYPVSFGPPAQPLPDRGQNVSDTALHDTERLEVTHGTGSDTTLWNPWDDAGPQDWGQEVGSALQPPVQDPQVVDLLDDDETGWLDDPWDPSHSRGLIPSSSSLHPSAHPSSSGQPPGTSEPPPGQQFSPWSVWNEAEEQHWRERQRQNTPVDANNSGIPHPSDAPTWDMMGTTTGLADAPASLVPSTFSKANQRTLPSYGHPSCAAGAVPIGLFNPAHPPKWPVDQSFAEDCHVLQILDPRVAPNSFTLFDVAPQVRIIPKPKGAGEIVLRDLAREHCRHLAPPVHIHRLSDEIPGFPRPQFTASAGQLPRLSFATPIDLRPSGWGVCVAHTYIGASLFSFSNDATSVCPVARFGQKIARGTLIASSAGRDLDPYEPVPVDVDHVRIRRAGIYPDSVPRRDLQRPVTGTGESKLECDLDYVSDHIDSEGIFQVAVHAPGCSSITVHAHLLDSPHALVRRASQHFLPIRPHTIVQASWPIEQPRRHSHLLHLLLDFDQQMTPDTTLFLVDCRGVEAAEGDFVTFNDRRDLMAGEIFAILRDKVTCRLPPAAILINGRSLATLGSRRYVSPLIRLLTREQCLARESNPDAGSMPHPTSPMGDRSPRAISQLGNRWSAYMDRAHGGQP